MLLAQTRYDPGALGHVIVSVLISPKNAGPKSFRMILDTGSSVTVLDNSVPSQYWSKKGSSIAVKGTISWFEAEPIQIELLEFGGHQFNRVNGIRADLSELSKREDHPIDGILGMDVLKGLCFGVDFINNNILWGPSPNNTYIQSLTYSKSHCPEIKLRLDEKTLIARLDVGADTFLRLGKSDTAHLTNQSKKISGYEMGLGSQQPLETTNLVGRTVSSGSARWEATDVEIGNGETTLLGLQAFWPLVWFDFPANKIGFSLDPKGYLQSIPALRMPLWAYWDRSKPIPELIVMAIKPGSRFESAGLLPGDAILEIGNLKQELVSIQGLQKILATQEAVSFVVKREGKFLSFDVVAQTGIK